jgi:hypothetical protein
MKHLNLTIGLIAINQLQLNHVISSSKLVLLYSRCKSRTKRC